MLLVFSFCGQTSSLSPVPPEGPEMKAKPDDPTVECFFRPERSRHNSITSVELASNAILSSNSYLCSQPDLIKLVFIILNINSPPPPHPTPISGGDMYIVIWFLILNTLLILAPAAINITVENLRFKVLHSTDKEQEYKYLKAVTVRH